MTHEVRVGQLVSVFGPGAIVDISEESFINCSIDLWHNPADRTTKRFEDVTLIRLAEELNVRRLWQPTTQKSRVNSSISSAAISSVKMCRFPQWMYCPTCRRMEQWKPYMEKRLGPDEAPYCKECSQSGRLSVLTPMPWVKVCEDGHMEEIDWNYLYHKGSNCTNKNPSSLRFESVEGGGTGFLGMRIVCEECYDEKERNHRTIRYFLQEIERQTCRGHQPWHRPNSAGDSCCRKYTMVQIGDSTTHYPIIQSAIDIPDGLDQSNAVENWDQWEILLKAVNLLKKFKQDWQKEEVELIQKCAQDMGVSEDHVIREIERTFDEPSAPRRQFVLKESQAERTLRLKSAEIPVLQEPERYRSSNFHGRRYTPSQDAFGEELIRLIDSISLIDRLREVRAFLGFRRLDPAGLMVSSSGLTDWLPAYEVYGEGIYINLNSDFLSAWESSLPCSAVNRVSDLNELLESTGLNERFPRVTPGFLAIHTFAHSLILQLCHDCGYPPESLRERIYVNQSSHGVLIYTADGDGQGTMGGLVKMGEEGLMGNVIAKALRKMSWCSSDPICMESTGQGLSGLNEAACHACSLLSETSCEFQNALLDRKMVVGSDEHEGLFSKALNEIGER